MELNIEIEIDYQKVNQGIQNIEFQSNIIIPHDFSLKLFTSKNSNKSIFTTKSKLTWSIINCKIIIQKDRGFKNNYNKN